MGHPHLTHLPPLFPQQLPAAFAHRHPALPAPEPRQHFPPQPRPCPSRTPPGQTSPSCGAGRAGMGVREQPGAGVPSGIASAPGLCARLQHSDLNPVGKPKNLNLFWKETPLCPAPYAFPTSAGSIAGGLVSIRGGMSAPGFAPHKQLGFHFPRTGAGEGSRGTPGRGTPGRGTPPLQDGCVGTGGWGRAPKRGLTTLLVLRRE